MPKNSFTAENLGRNTFKSKDKSIEDRYEMQIIHDRLNALGIHLGDGLSICSDGAISNDECIAVQYVCAGKSIPVDVEQRLIDSLYTKHGIARNTKDITISDAEIARIMNGNYED
jgi:hypothetical protein